MNSLTTIHSVRTTVLILVVLATQGVATAEIRQWPAARISATLRYETTPADLNHGPFSSWQALSSAELGGVVHGWGAPVSIAAHDPAQQGLQLVREATSSTAEYSLLTTTQAPNCARYFYRELRNGLPVFSGILMFSVNQENRVSRWMVRSHDSFPVRDSHILTEIDAANQLLPSVQGKEWSIERSTAGWYPDYDLDALLPCFWIRLAGGESWERWEGIVEASTGEVLHEWSGIHTDVVSGTVSGMYWQPYEQSEPSVGPHPFQTVFVNGNAETTDAAGFFMREAGNTANLVAELRGPYVDVDNEDADEDAQLIRTYLAPFDPVLMNWTTAEATAPELNLFFHTQAIHDWYKILDPEFDALDYPLPAVANVGTAYDNAYWNGFGTYYGSGSQYNNFAMYSDVIYHEYTHGVTDGIYPDNMLPYIDQPGALNEAWSDYFACTINGDPLMGDYMLGGNPHSAFRDLEDDMVFPEEWHGEVHADSPFISAPLWTIRAGLGTTQADALAHFARYGLAETFFDYLVAVLETDDNDGDLSNGTPNGSLIYQAFGDHGIGPGDLPQFEIMSVSYVSDGTLGSMGDGDRFVEPAERVALTFILRNSSPLFPPPATDVVITVSTNDPTAAVSNSPQGVSMLAPGQTFAPQPFLIEYSGSAPDHWATLSIDVTSNGGAASVEHTLEYTVGTPHLLVVADDPDTDVEHFVTDAIRSQDKIFDRVDLAPNALLPPDRVPGYGVILWLSGNADGNVVQTMDQYLLQSFLNAVNKIILSGQNIADALDNGSFAENVLQVEIVADSLSSNAVTADEEPLTPFDWYLLSGANGAGNQREPSTFTAFGGSVAVGHYGRGTTGPTAIVEFANGNGLLFGFGLEAISGQAGSHPLAELFSSIYTWADTLLDATPSQEPAVIPTELAVTNVYPNPFNATAQIAYQLPTGGQGRIVLFDLLGRVADQIAISGYSGTVSWSPRLGSGIYFAQVESAGSLSPATKLVLLR